MAKSNRPSGGHSYSFSFSAPMPVGRFIQFIVLLLYPLRLIGVRIDVSGR